MTVTRVELPGVESTLPQDGGQGQRLSDHADPGPELVIRARRGWIPVDWRELISHRELLLFLVWRDIKVKYKQAVLGFAWAIFVPVISVALFTFIGMAAGFTAKVQPGVPYPVFVYAGLLPWLFLQSSINNGGLSLISQQALLSKIYMPRLFIPTATVGGALVDFCLSFLVLCGVTAIFGFMPSWQIVFLLPLLLLALTLALGIAFLLSALTVVFRDMRFLIPFFAQLLMWISAAVYPPRIFGQHEHWLAINPVYGVISGFRSALLGEPWKPAALTIAAIEAIVLFVFGLFYFKRAERRFADIA